MTFIDHFDETGIQFGDDLILKEYDYKPMNSTDSEVKKGLTGRELKFKAGFIHYNSSTNMTISLLLNNQNAQKPKPKPKKKAKG